MSEPRDWISTFKAEPRRSGLFLDFDGTLSAIAPTPAEAVLHPRAAEILPDLARRYPFCVMSGRRAASVASLVGLAHVHYVGLHGMEWMEDEPHIDPEVLPYLPTLDRAREELKDSLTKLPGVFLENKLASISLHLRQVPEMEEQALQLAESLADNLGLKLERGRMTLELRPPVDVNKGTVLIRLAAGWRLKRGLYAGDDLTDVAGFRGLRYLMKEGGFDGIAIAVLSPETPIELEAVADMTVDGPDGLLDLLSQL
ncbi:MAG: trehalose-phosphatase [Actinobacteria bacterium]|nr:trehalose-phosphatase [Actinomycetota bacterium]